jgi:hypothetical protein
MDYKFEDIDGIVSSSSLSEPQKISALLKIDCFLYTQLGTDSTEAEKKRTKSKSKKIYSKIKSIDEATGKLFLSVMDNNA